MIYNNLIYFLVVILILSTNAVPDQPQYSLSLTLALFIFKLAIFNLLEQRIFSPKRIRSAGSYTNAERRGSILAIIFFAADIYLLDWPFYFAKLPLAHALPMLTNLWSLLLFVIYLIIMWFHAAECYAGIFGRSQSNASYIAGNLTANLPIVLPWLLITLFADLLQLLPFPQLKAILASAWGEGLVFLLFFGMLVIIFPFFITRLWNCKPLPPSDARRRIEAFCKKEKVNYAEIMSWPLFEGQALTAGVMGLIKRFRYLLVTPGLLAALTPDEIEAVIAHEIGHVKRRHLQLYLLLFLGFGLIAQMLTYPIFYLLSTSDLFYRVVHVASKEPGNVLALASTIPMFILMIVYFRYIVGFFMRNFERQADLYALKTMKSSFPLIRVFEKIAYLSGNTKDLPSWHHFGIGQRIDFLLKSEKNPALIEKHDRKIRGALIIYTFIFLSSAFVLWKMPADLLEGAPREKFAEAVILQKIEQDPQNFIWHQLLGDLQFSRKKYSQTIEAYEQTLLLAPDNFEVLNNLAWLYLTAEDESLHNSKRALELAKKAVVLRPSPHILDTLALAYWRNGHQEQAILAEKRALAQKPQDPRYYQSQLKKFLTTSPPDPLE